MASKGYTTKTAIENTLLETIDSSFDTALDLFIEEVEQFIENYTGRIFIADSTASEKLYDGDGSKTLFIDECIDLDGGEGGSPIKIDDVELLGGEVGWLYPANTTPKNRIVMESISFTKGHQNISIIAKWGYSVACPAAIRMAATTLVIGRLQYSHNTPKSEKIGDYSISYSDDVGWQSYTRALEILDQYKKFSF